jgi:CIC family chloride channel protein
MNTRFIDADVKSIRLLVYAFVIGLLVGVVSGVFRLTLARIETFRDGLFSGAANSEPMNWLVPILFTVTGIGVALFLVKKFAPEASGSGVQEIEGALDERLPMRWKRVLPVKFFASLFSLGSGLLLGREGPTIQIGANVGKMVKDIFKQPVDEGNPLISAGAAAGLASAFNAPFSGIIFVIEEMHDHFKFNFFSVAAVMIGAGTADFVVRAMVGDDPSIQMTVFESPVLMSFWLFVMLGIALGVVGYVYNILLVAALNLFGHSFKMPIIVITVIAGLVIAFTGIFFPEMIGGGYEAIGAVLQQSFTLSFLLVLFVIRLLLSIFSYAIGVPGGIFAPMLTLGVILGMLFGTGMQHFFPDLVAQPGIFAVAGMAAIFASTVRAPLTGLVLAVEMTSNFELILPLIVTTVTASAVTVLLGNKPIYSTLLQRTLASEKPG